MHTTKFCTGNQFNMIKGNKNCRVNFFCKEYMEERDLSPRPQRRRSSISRACGCCLGRSNGGKGTGSPGRMRWNGSRHGR